MEVQSPSEIVESFNTIDSPKDVIEAPEKEKETEATKEEKTVAELEVSPTSKTEEEKVPVVDSVETSDIKEMVAVEIPKEILTEVTETAGPPQEEVSTSVEITSDKIIVETEVEQVVLPRDDNTEKIEEIAEKDISPKLEENPPSNTEKVEEVPVEKIKEENPVEVKQNPVEEILPIDDLKEETPQNVEIKAVEPVPEIKPEECVEVTIDSCEEKPKEIKEEKIEIVTAEVVVEKEIVKIAEDKITEEKPQIIVEEIEKKEEKIGESPTLVAIEEEEKDEEYVPENVKPSSIADDDYYDEEDEIENEEKQAKERKMDEIEIVSIDDDDDDDEDEDAGREMDEDYDEDDMEDFDEINMDSEHENIDDSDDELQAIPSNKRKMDLSSDYDDYNEDDEDEDDDDDVQVIVDKSPRKEKSAKDIKDNKREKGEADEKGFSTKLKYKSYSKKVLSNLRKRSIKLLNKRMHVMEDNDILECDTKIINLTTNIKPTINDTKESLSKKKNDENKENQRKAENLKATKNGDIKEADDDDDIIEEVMDDIDDIIDSDSKHNGNEEDFNDALAFQMDVDDEDELEDEEEEAVDLSSSYEINISDAEIKVKDDEPVAIDISDSSPEKTQFNIKISHVEENVRSDIIDKLDKIPAPPPPPPAIKDVIEEIKQEVIEETKDDEVVIKDDGNKEVDNPIKSSPSLDKIDNVKEEEVSRKRARSPEDDKDEPIIPSKKLRNELDSNYHTHDRLLKEYIETTSNNTVDDIQKHADSLVVEIQTLNEMIRAKEVEWNNMLHLKKVKEEILLRLTRKRHVMDIMTTKLGEVSEYSVFDSPSLSNKRSSSSAPGSIVMNSSTSTPAASKKDVNLSNQMNNSSSIKMVPLVSSTPTLITSTNTILQSRANMKSCDVAKEKSNAVQLQRQILPKPVLSNHQQILNNLAFSAGLTSSSSAAALQQQSQQAASFANNHPLVNGHHNPNQPLQVGRQGVIKDVKSIIADYRQKHPEIVPRRGRRMKNTVNYNDVSSSRNLRASTDSRMSELGLLLSAVDGNSRPSSNDSSHSNSNNLASSTTNLSFKDVLVQFAKMSQNERQLIGSTAQNLLSNMNSSSNPSGSQTSATNLTKPSYPEVTLHPVSNAAAPTAEVNLSAQSNNSSSNSLLHGILTKSSSRPNSGFTTFSPTLARLLTAPERLSSHAAVAAAAANNTNNQFQQQQQQSNLSGGINLSKSHSEITITPVVASNIQQSLMQQQHQLQKQQQQLQQLQQQQQQLMKTEHFMNMDDEADDSVDRLVIDEGDDHQQQQHPSNVVTTAAQEFHENEVPECQGCKKREAQFVCAGCGNQWYCSRECQVAAWDEHSEVCTG